MEFTLTYRGPLKANAGPSEKQAIRRALHPQFQLLWSEQPLKSIASTFLHPQPPPNDKYHIIRKIDEFTFAPLVCESTRWTVALDILMLRPELPGSIITQGGDIDNRIKTLFDSLRMPRNINEIPKGDPPRDNENPFYCLMEDDNLITDLSVRTERLLEVINKNEVWLIIKVKTTAHYSVFGNMLNL